jgi:ubiquinone/menaquinone biosynthesis C-methylase UbiE
MPDEATWEGFFDVRRVLEQLDFSDSTDDVVDFGCGYGTFAIAAAERTTGIVHALDIEPRMLSTTATKAASLGLANVRTIERDFVAHGAGLPEGLAGYAMLFNILHGEQPLKLLQEAFRVLRIGGRVGIIHWIPSADTPRGPDLSIRPRAVQCQEWLREAGFELRIPSVDLPPYHYGVVGLKAQSDPTRLTMSNQ